MDSSLFIGLVTHPNSRFPEASGPEGLAHRLTHEMKQRGWRVDFVCESRNRVDPDALDLSLRGIRSSIDQESASEYEWSLFQDPRRSLIALRMKLRAQRVLRKWRYARFSAQARDRGRRMVLRLANIECAHLALMDAALASNAQWALILEDDARSIDIPGLADDLSAHLAKWVGELQPKYVNISESFSVTELGIRDVPAKAEDWNEHSSVLSAPTPYTNTVCAILYRREFLRDLHQELATIPLEPVIPIDWKLNRAIMALEAQGKLASGDCYAIDPAPIIQGSMHVPPHPTNAG